MKKFLLLTVTVLLLSSCVYTSRFDVSQLEKMGGEGRAVITVSVPALIESGVIENSDLLSRVDRVSLELAPESTEYPLPLSEWSVTGTANGLLSSTEVGTFMIWSPDFIRSRTAGPKHYVNRSLGIEAGVPEEGIALFTTGSYNEAYSRLFSSSSVQTPLMVADAMRKADAALYLVSPVTLPPLGFDIPRETMVKIESILLLLESGSDSFMLSGVIDMDSEDSARTLCTYLRNLLVQDIRRRGEKLDVKALSGIFTYEGTALRISDFTVSFDSVSGLLTKEL